MSEARSKVDWCFRKAEREESEGKEHKGLKKTESNGEEARKHIAKGEHYLYASEYLKKGGFSDVAASTLFYAGYHALLAIGRVFGYESKNQECTFALIYWLIEEKKIDVERELVQRVASIEKKKPEELTSRDVREQYQYGTELSLPTRTYEKESTLAKALLLKAKEIIETHHPST